MIKRTLTFFAALALLPGMAMAQSFEAGSDYRISEREQRMTDQPREVVEFFWYGCGACYAFLPMAEDWKKELPEDVAFERVPAILNPAWRTHGKAYYVADSLDMQEEIHQAMFDAIHVDGRRMNTQDMLRDLFVEHGADPDEFDRAYDSFAVDSQMRQAENLARRFQIRSTPTVVVNGKYVSDLGGLNGLVELGNYLLERD